MQEKLDKKVQDFQIDTTLIKEDIDEILSDIFGEDYEEIINSITTTEFISFVKKHMVKNGG